MTIRWNELPVGDWVALNAQLRRVVAALGQSTGIQSASVTGTLTLTSASTLVRVDTTSGNVTLTLPSAATVTGARVEVKKLVAANTLTLSSASLIDGAATLAWTTALQSYSLISDGATYHVV